jgi:hypothetical protein
MAGRVKGSFKSAASDRIVDGTGKSLVMSIWEYVYLAVGTGIVGAIATLILVLVCGHLGVNVIDNVWLLGIPLALSLFLNVSAIELYRRLRGR